MNDLIELDVIDLVLALGLIGISIALSAWQKLGLEVQYIFAAGRSLLQLTAIGYILVFIFELNNPIAVLFVLGIMLTIAALVAKNRISKKIKGLFGIVWGSLFASSFLTLSYTITTIVQPDNWYQPQYLIPMAGMVFGHAINGASLAGERLVSNINNNRLEIETYLCLGATPKQAITIYRKEAIRIGIIPTLNQMMVVGMVSLPGMFTGQVLAGSDPLEAASYQILILFILAAANLITVFLISEGIYIQFFNKDIQLIYSGLS